MNIRLIVYPLAIALEVQLVQAGTYTVTSVGDGTDTDAGTLRWAITAANGNAPGPNVIKFNIPGDGVHVIQPLAALPPISRALVIDGTSQQGYATAGTPLIEIDGNLLRGIDGLTIGADGCAIYGLAIHNFTSTPGVLAAAVHIINSGSTTIRSNYFGLTGAGVLGPGLVMYCGLHLENSWENEIGGRGSGGNVISGNLWFGVLVEGTSATNNVIEGNRIGTDVNGTRSIANGTGVYIGGSDSNRVGGVASGSRNIISGNSSNGVWIVGGSSNLVQNNYIGTDCSGAIALPNFWAGVAITSTSDEGSFGNRVVGNVLSGNTSFGIYLSPNHVDVFPITHVYGNAIERNLIGVDKNGVLPLGNGADGISMLSYYADRNVAVSNIIAYNTRNGVYLSGIDNFIGAGNQIHDNGRNGVAVYDPSDMPAGIGNSIRTNSIYLNGVLGIDLADNGILDSNDYQDPDTGANNLQNSPVLTAAYHGWNCVTVRGTFNSTPNQSFMLDFFFNPGCSYYLCDGTNQYFIGSLTLSTDGNGDASFDATFPFHQPFGLSHPKVSATATIAHPGVDTAEWDTSEFSACVWAIEPPAIVTQTAGNTINLSWTDDGAEWALEWASQLTSAVWNPVAPPPTCALGVCRDSVQATANAMFFRLGCPP